MTTKGTKVNLNDNLKKLAGIVQWFEDQRELDIEQGLEKVREASNLVKDSRARLAQIENEFEVIKSSLDSSSSEPQAPYGVAAPQSSLEQDMSEINPDDIPF